MFNSQPPPRDGASTCQHARAPLRALRTWLTRSVLKVLNGADYFYEWRGDPAALLRFVRVQDVGWYLEQIEGVDGESVSEKTQQQVTDACSRSPVMCACEPNGFDSAFVERVLSAVT